MPSNKSTVSQKAFLLSAGIKKMAVKKLSIRSPGHQSTPHLSAHDLMGDDESAGRWTKSSPFVIGMHRSSLSAGVKVCSQLLCSQSVACSPGPQRSSGKLGSRGGDKQKGATVSRRSCSLTRLSFLHNGVTFLFEGRNDRQNGF